MIERLAQAVGDRYRVERELGRGGMATVYLASDLKHNRQVAIKLLAADLGVESPDRFLREIAIAAQLSHPHILSLYDSGTADGLLYYVMPFVAGESLRARMARERQLPVEDAVAIARHVAAALSYAHMQGVVHRDIKPENILLHEGEPMVADFGLALALAKVSSTRITQSGTSVGTPEYMSPEQSFGDQVVDGRTDLYSLACVLYEMLAGEAPYVGPTAMSILSKRMVDPVPSVRRLRSSVPAHVDEALTKALARSVADRFTSLSAFAAALVAPAAPMSRVPVVAVLPFLSISSDPDNEYFADGITEDVITHLSKLRTLDVISRTSVMAFKQRTQSVQEMAATLNAGTLLDGSVRRVGNRVRIAAHLIDAKTLQHVWAETYDRDLTDIFAIQTDVALQIAAALRAELTPDQQSRIRREPTQDVAAYQLYMRGRHCVLRYSREGLQEGIRFFEKALERDTRFATARAAIAMAWLELGETGEADPIHAYSEARAAIAAALARDPELADAHCALGHLRVVADFDWVGAESAFTRALELQPGHADALDLYGRMCAAQARFEEGLALTRRAVELDPIAHRADTANALLRAGRLEEAVTYSQHVVTVDPQFDRGHMTLGWALHLLGRTEEALVSLRRAMALSPDSAQWLSQYGEALGLAGRTEEARAILAQITALRDTRYVSPYHMAYVLTGLGEHDEAVAWLERAFQTRAGAIYGIKGSFLFAPLREHPGFLSILKRMNLS